MKKYKEKYAYKNVQLEDKYDLVDSIWAERPAMSEYPVFLLDEKYSGEGATSKLSRVREEMKKVGATAHLLITLDDIAWLLNFRGRDVAYTPVVLSYAIIMMDCVHLFINENKLSDEVKSVLAKDNVIFHPYNDIYEFTSTLTSDEVVLLDPARLNYALYNRIPSNIKIVEAINPALLFKAVKNEVEIENIKKAHIKDAIAHTKFMHWVKTTYDKETLTELSASDKLEEFRAEQKNFLWPSFAPISAYGPHAAMCHYSSSEETNVVLEGGTLYLTDTGGNYMEGSTDITRTVALGEISSELKRDFTNVLRGNLALSKAKFLYGGDHGEWPHDGNFCVDGLLYPDRRLHTGAKQMKNVYRPIRATLEDKKLKFLNTNRFRNTSYLTAVWELVKNGNILLAADKLILDIDPESTLECAVELNIPDGDCDCHLNIYYYNGDNEIAFEQIALKEEYTFKPEKSKEKLSLASNEENTVVNFCGGSITFNAENGMIESYVVNGKETVNNSPAFAKGFIPNIYRAYLDNDTRYRDEWIKAGYDDYSCLCTDFEAELEKGKAEIEITYKLKSNKTKKILAEVEIEYDVYADGTVKVETEFKPVTGKKLAAHMPRFGLTLEMPEAFRNVEYYGMGDCENLSDIYSQAIVGVYNTTVEDMHEPYIRPQDSGNRCAVRYLKVTDADGDGIKFAYDDNYFNFNAREFTQKLLQNAAHQEDLHDEKTTVINIDGFTRGTGTASCGPDVLPQFEVDGSKGLEFSFYMMPANK